MEELAMKRLTILAGAMLISMHALAQTPPAPPPPAFAASNLTPNGVRSLAANCAACHGTNGKAQPGSTVAGLAGRPAAQLVAAMQEFKDGKRLATIMHQIAKGYSTEEIAALADYFAKQPQ
jgi:cytochrome subunit of sulfide dehydrogenase